MLSNTIAFVLSNFGLVMFVLALIFTLLQRLTNKTLATSEILYSWISLLPLGITAFYSFIMHAFFPDFTASMIGWQNSPFQFEVAVANLGFGTLGIFAFKASYGFRLANVVGNTCWLWGDGVGHIYQMITQHNFTVGNAGSWFWLDMLAPLLAIICIIKLKNDARYSRLFH